MKKILICLLTVSFLVSACAASSSGEVQEGIAISNPYAHAAGAGETSAAYMSITNNGAEADRLIGVTCDAAMMTQPMKSSLEGDVMSMGDVTVIDLPAGATVELKPGGYHIMLMDLKQEIKAGSTIRMSFDFEKAGRITLDVPVLSVVTPP